ncbi:MAG: Ig-like protein, partial [Thermoleophilia bacterium]|nr:Ig-like protein [Thermoleophilia bacterium]
PVSVATAYWTSLAGSSEIANGVNGFSTPVAGSWSVYGNTCETRVSGYAAGAYCKFRFNVPGGTTALEGIARGQYSIANTNMVLRSERPGGNPSYVLDATTKGAFGHGFGRLGAYFDIGFFTKAATSMSGAYNWMHVDTFEVRLDDPSAPVSTGEVFYGASASGWYGRGCVGGSYGWSDGGSQLWSTSLTNLTTGQVIHVWRATPPHAVVTSGVPAVNFSACITAPATGSYTMRSAASDRAGNSSAHDFVLRFDTTQPEIGAPELGGAALSDGTLVGAASSYRPQIIWRGVSDVHSGIAAITASANGQTIPVSVSGSTVTLTPQANVPLGPVAITLRVSDQVGNVAEVTRTVVVRDDAAPTLSVASPGSVGGARPVIDVSGADDYSGVDVATWTVLVDGEVLVASSATQRLQADVGLLADGTHTIQISITDRSGNVGSTTIAYTADSGPSVPQLPDGFTSGIYVYEAPTTSAPGATHRFRAVMVQHGRPVTGRADIREATETIASKELEESGTVDMAITINKPRTELTYHAPAGVSLTPVSMLVSCAECTRGSTPPGSALAVKTHASGGDRVAPKWRLKLVPTKAGAVKRAHTLTFRLWTNELAVVQLMPIGSRNRVTVSARARERVIHVTLDPKSSLAKRLHALRAGVWLRVRMRVVATDTTGNRSLPQTATFSVLT